MASSKRPKAVKAFGQHVGTLNRHWYAIFSDEYLGKTLRYFQQFGVFHVKHQRFDGKLFLQSALLALGAWLALVAFALILI